MALLDNWGSFEVKQKPDLEDAAFGVRSKNMFTQGTGVGVPFGFTIKDEEDFVCLMDEVRSEEFSNLKDDGPFLCGQCGFTTIVKKVFLDHLWDHDSKEELQLLTDLLVEEESNLGEKARDSRDKKKDWECPSCGYKSGSMEGLKRHWRRKHKRSVSGCPCTKGRIQTSSGALMRLKNLGADTRFFPFFACTKCRYLPERIVKQRVFTCGSCKYMTTKRKGLREHQRMHICKDLVLEKVIRSVKSKAHEKEIKEGAKFSCSKCDYKTESEAMVSLHERIHSQERPFNCSYCGFTAAHRSTMESHVAARHSAQVEGGRWPRPESRLRPAAQAKLQPLAFFACSKCEFSTVHRRYFKLHESSHRHEVEELLRCFYCSFKTDVKRRLSKHLRARHPPKKPQVCCQTEAGKEELMELRELFFFAEHNYSLPSSSSARPKRKKSQRGGPTNSTGERREGRRRFTCNECSFTTYLSTTLKVHESTEHKGGEMPPPPTILSSPPVAKPRRGVVTKKRRRMSPNASKKSEQSQQRGTVNGGKEEETHFGEELLTSFKTEEKIEERDPLLPYHLTPLSSINEISEGNDTPACLSIPLSERMNPANGLSDTIQVSRSGNENNLVGANASRFGSYTSLAIKEEKETEDFLNDVIAHADIQSIFVDDPTQLERVEMENAIPIPREEGIDLDQNVGLGEKPFLCSSYSFSPPSLETFRLHQFDHIGGSSEPGELHWSLIKEENDPQPHMDWGFDPLAIKDMGSEENAPVDHESSEYSKMSTGKPKSSWKHRCLECGFMTFRTIDFQRHKKIHKEEGTKDQFLTMENCLDIGGKRKWM